MIVIETEKQSFRKDKLNLIINPHIILSKSNLFEVLPLTGGHRNYYNFIFPLNLEGSLDTLFGEHNFFFRCGCLHGSSSLAVSLFSKLLWDFQQSDNHDFPCS